MFRRLIARLLIFGQIYSSIFQGVAHAADLADSYPIRGEIHLRSSVNKFGNVQLAIGTDNGTENPELLGIIDLPNCLKQKLNTVIKYSY